MRSVLALAVLFVVAVATQVALSALFLYAGWNWGLVPATADTSVAVHEIGLAPAFWLSTLLSLLANYRTVAQSARRGRDE